MFFPLRREVFFIGTILFPNVVSASQPLDMWLKCERKPLMTSKGKTLQSMPSYLNFTSAEDGSLRFTINAANIYRLGRKEYDGIAFYEGRYFEDLYKYSRIEGLYKWNWKLYDSIFTKRPSIWHSNVIPLDLNENFCQTQITLSQCQTAKIGYSFATLSSDSFFPQQFSLTS